MQDIFKSNKLEGGKMKAMRNRGEYSGWEYEQLKKQEKKKHKAFRNQRKNKSQWEEVEDI